MKTRSLIVRSMESIQTTGHSIRTLSVGFGLLLLTLALAVPGWSVPLYVQPWDNTGNVAASQNDTAFYGNFATTYDNFHLGGTAPPAGQPGALLANWVITGPGNENFIGPVNGTLMFSYDLALGSSYTVSNGTQYWLSLVPDLAYPPQWGWASGTGGEGIAYQDFQSVRGQLSNDMAFTLLGNGNSFDEVQFIGGYFNPSDLGQITSWSVSLWADAPAQTPEPGSLVLMGSGVLSLAGLLRRRLLP